MADVTNQNLRINGVNQDTNFVKQEAYIVDCTELSAILATGTHDLVNIKVGEMLSKLKLVVLEGATSTGSATIQFKADFDGTSEAINSTAIAIANLAKGDVVDLPVTGIKGFDQENVGTIQMAVATAALTAFKFVLVVETIPVVSFITMG